MKDSLKFAKRESCTFLIDRAVCVQSLMANHISLLHVQEAGYLTPGGYVLQDSCNVLLQQYLVELMDSGQHSLMPVYACHLRADERREVSVVTPLY